MEQSQNFLTPNQPSGIQQIPDYISALYKPGENHLKDFGILEPSDWGLNFLRVLQATMRQAKPGWGPTGQEPALTPGTILLDQKNKIVPIGTEFVALLRSVIYIKFRSKKPEDGIDFMTRDPHDPRIVACNGLDFVRDPRTGKNLPPPVTKMVKFYIVTPFNPEEPAVLSFQRTSTNIGRKLTKDIAMATACNNQTMALPMYVCKFKILPPKLIEEGSLSWFAFNYQPNGFVSEEALKKLEKLYQFAKMLDQASETANEQENKRISESFTNESKTTVENTPLPGQTQSVPEAPATQTGQAPAQDIPQPTPQPNHPNVTLSQEAAPPNITPTTVITPPIPQTAPQTASQGPNPNSGTSAQNPAITPPQRAQDGETSTPATGPQPETSFF